MLSEFHYSDFIPEDSLRIQANQALDRMLELAPYGSMAVAMLRKTGELYSCSIDIYSRIGPFVARTVQATPLLAVSHAQDILTDKLRDWQKRRSLIHSRAAHLDRTAAHTKLNA